MWTPIRDYLDRRRAVRRDAALLVRQHGRHAARVAQERANDSRGRDPAEVRHWRAVARFAGPWEAHLSVLDPQTRNRLLERTARRV